MYDCSTKIGPSVASDLYTYLIKPDRCPLGALVSASVATGE